MRQRTGSIDKTADGRYRVRVTTAPRVRETLDYFDSEEEADAARRAALEILNRKPPKDAVTLLDYGNAWLEARDVGRLVRDPDSDWSRWNHHIKDDPIAKLALRSIRRRHVRDWVRRVRRKVSRSTTLNTLNIVRGALGAAVEDEIIRANPASGVKVAREKRTEEEWTFATPAEQYRMIVCSDVPECWILAFAFGTGLRAGEIVSLRLADLHVDGDNPRVVVRYGGAPKEPTKGGKIRTVPLLGYGLLGAREWLKALPSWAKRNPLGLAFPRLRGAYRDELHIVRWNVWKETLAAAGITRRFRFHDARHTAAAALVSGWLGRRWTLIEVRDFLGHESVTTTERYAHLAGTALTSAAQETRAASAAGSSSGLMWPRGAAARHVKEPGILGAPPARIERATCGLGKPWSTSEILGQITALGHSPSVYARFLAAQAAGDERAADEAQSELAALAQTSRAEATRIALSVLLNEKAALDARREETA